MRTHRGKQFDWTKPFKLVESKAVFESLDADNVDLVININTRQENHDVPIAKKQQIIIPKIETIKRITQPKKFAKCEANYIRLADNLNLPKLMSYELNEVDHVFLQGHSNRFKLNGKTVLTPEFLSHAFIELELKAGKDPLLPRTKGWMTAYIEREHKHLLVMPNIEQLTEVFYNYWKNRREELKFPMLRQLWRLNPDQYNPLLAFKPREKEKRNLRRTNRLAEDQIAQQLEQEFSLATKVVQRIRIKQKTKLKLAQFQLTSFHNECKQFFGTPSFFEPFDMEMRSKDKETLKKLQGEVQLVKKQQIEDEKQNELEVYAQQTLDQKQSVVDFLATVVSVSESLGISYQKIYHDKPGHVHKVNPKAEVSVHQEIPVEPETQTEKEDHLHVRLYRDNQTIYRTLEDRGQETHEKAPTTFFEYCSRLIQSSYYGSDDEGTDIKDLKRNTSANFKKFQQNFKVYASQA